MTDFVTTRHGEKTHIARPHNRRETWCGKPVYRDADIEDAAGLPCAVCERMAAARSTAR
jgi:hypothetical protein